MHGHMNGKVRPCHQIMMKDTEMISRALNPPSHGWSPENTSPRPTAVKLSNQKWKELYGSRDIDDEKLAVTCASFDVL